MDDRQLLEAALTWIQRGATRWLGVDQSGLVVGKIEEGISSRLFDAVLCSKGTLGEYITLETAKSAITRAAASIDAQAQAKEPPND